jgi:hypothetical protein
MQVQMTRPMAIEHLKSQIAQMEKQGEALEKTVADLTAALGCFNSFIESPSLTNAGKLAEGLKWFVTSQLHSLALKAKLDAETITNLRSQLTQIESMIQPATLNPSPGGTRVPPGSFNRKS